MNSPILIIPEIETITLGSMEAVIDAIVPDGKYPIKGKIMDEKVSWDRHGVCKEHTEDKLYNLQMGQDEIILVLNQIWNLKKR